MSSGDSSIKTSCYNLISLYKNSSSTYTPTQKGFHSTVLVQEPNCSINNILKIYQAIFLKQSSSKIKSLPDQTQVFYFSFPQYQLNPRNKFSTLYDPKY